MRLLIRGGTVVAPAGLRERHTLIVESRYIAAIEPDGAIHPRRDDRVVDADGRLVAPGLIDLHVHGGDGADTMDGSPEGLRTMARFLARHGVTAFVPTTLAAAHDHTLRAVRAVGEAMRQGSGGARILGVHLEGPYLNPVQAGAQPTELIRPPDRAELDAYLAAGPVQRLTLAPEMPGAERLVRRAVARGVRVGLGHTAADYGTVLAGVGWGLSYAAHTFNAMSGLHHRRPGTAGAALTCDRLYAEVIVDRIHVHPAVVDLLVRAKGIERTLLVSDAGRAAGLPNGAYSLGGEPVTVQDGVARLADGRLAGSTLTLDAALRNLMDATGLSLVEALPMGTRVPAASLGLADRLGRLAPGCPADVVVLTDDVRVGLTMVDGRIVYRV